MQVQEACDDQDFVIIYRDAPPDIDYSQVRDDEFRTDPEFSDRKVSFCGVPDQDNPGRTRVQMTIKEHL